MKPPCIAGMQQRRAVLLDKAKSLTEAAVAETRALRPNELAEVIDLRTEAEALTKQIAEGEEYYRRMAATAVPIKHAS